MQKKESVTIKSLTREILQNSATPDRYQTKAKNTVERNIGTRTIQGSAIGSRLNKNLVNRAIMKTLSRKYKRLIR